MKTTRTDKIFVMGLIIIFIFSAASVNAEKTIIPVSKKNNQPPSAPDVQQASAQIQASKSKDNYVSIQTKIEDCKVWNGNTIYCGLLNGIYKSTNFGKSWSLINPGTNWYNVRRVFISSTGWIFYARDMDETLYRSNVKSDTKWNPVLRTICKGSTFWNLAEDKSGSLYAGEYSTLIGAPCAYIWKSTDNGATWSIVYDSSSYGIGEAVHIHFVAVDPYTDYIYASQDSDGFGFGTKALIRSIDSGKTWQLLKSGERSAYTTIQFAKGARLLGEDTAFAGDCSIVKTGNDKDFTPVLVLTGNQVGNFYSSSKTSNGVLVFGTVVQDEGNHATIWKSYDGGSTWRLSKDFGYTGQWSGIYGISNPDSQGYLYIYELVTKFGQKVKIS